MKIPEPVFDFEEITLPEITLPPFKIGKLPPVQSFHSESIDINNNVNTSYNYKHYVQPADPVFDLRPGLVLDLHAADPNNQCFTKSCSSYPLSSGKKVLSMGMASSWKFFSIDVYCIKHSLVSLLKIKVTYLCF